MKFCYIQGKVAKSENFFDWSSWLYFEAGHGQTNFTFLWAESSRYLQLLEDQSTWCKFEELSQKNESINQQIARFAPKFKHNGTTTALDTRLATVVGINKYGYKLFYKKLLNNIRTSQNDIYASIGISRCHLIKLNNRKNKKAHEIFFLEWPLV